MRKTYADLHVCANLSNLRESQELVEKVSQLGYETLAIPLNGNVEMQIQSVRNLCKDIGVDFVSRIDLRPRNPQILLRELRKYRRSFEIVAVLCDSKPIARQAAKDRRVDLLNFPQIDFRRRFFDLAEAELASQRLASFEIDARPLLTLEGRDRISLLSSLRREIATAVSFHVPIVLSSGISEPMLVRAPMELAALSSLFGLAGNSAVDAVSVNPSAIIKRNREKLDSKFVAPGIRVVRKGSDC